MRALMRKCRVSRFSMKGSCLSYLEGLKSISGHRRFFVLSVLVGVAGAFSLLGGNQPAKDVKKMKVLKPIIQDSSISIDYPATLRARQSIDVRTRLKGVIEQVASDEGSSILAGDTIIILRDDEYQQELSKAKAALKSAKTEERLIQMELANVTRLVEKKIAAQTEANILAAKLEVAKAKVEENAALAATAELNLSRTRIQAPFDGQIGTLSYRVGSLVEEGEVLTSLVNSSEMWAYFNVTEQDLAQLSSTDPDIFNRPARFIHVTGKEYPTPGVIEMVSNGVEPETGVVTMRARFPNESRELRHGSTGKVQLTIPFKSALLIPQRSTLEIQDKRYVYSVDKDGQVALTNVLVRAEANDQYIVEGGLTSESLIIADGVQHVSQGESIDYQLESP